MILIIFFFFLTQMNAMTIKFFKLASAPQHMKSGVLRGLFWDSSPSFHNPPSSPLPHPAKSSPFSAFKCSLISLTPTHSMAVIWFVPIFHLQQVHIYRLVCQQGEMERDGVGPVMFLSAVTARSREKTSWLFIVYKTCIACWWQQNTKETFYI